LPEKWGKKFDFLIFAIKKIKRKLFIMKTEKAIKTSLN